MHIQYDHLLLFAAAMIPTWAVSVEQHELCLCWQTHYRYAGWQLSHYGAGLERDSAERHGTDIFAEQFSACYWPGAREQRQ